MSQQEVIDKTVEHVRKILEGEGSGHDWWHIYRVWKNAIHIGEKEGADLYVVQLAALLHDIADWKFHDGDDTVGPRVAREFLESLNVGEDIIAHVCDIIANLSFKGAGVKSEMKTPEGKVVQDADRLDALGAIGIARAFAYGGNKSRPLYIPDVKPVMHQTKEDYFKGDSHTVNHFYEKLLLLKDRLNTDAARQIAADRHTYMEKYLERFYSEWEGNA